MSMVKVVEVKHNGDVVDALTKAEHHFLNERASKGLRSFVLAKMKQRTSRIKKPSIWQLYEGICGGEQKQIEYQVIRTWVHEPDPRELTQIVLMTQQGCVRPAGILKQ